MTEDEDFQYVVSRQDYLDLQNSKAKYQKLTQMLSEAKLFHAQDKKGYLSKIAALQEELKSYKTSVRHYVDREVAEIDSLLRMLSDYRSSMTPTALNSASIERIRSQCQKISGHFDISFRNLETINSEVITVIKSLMSDSLSMKEKLKQYSQLYENVIEEKQLLESNIRQMKEQSERCHKLRQRLRQDEEKLIYENEMLKYNIKQKQLQCDQLSTVLLNQKNRFTAEINTLRQQSLQSDKKWREAIQSTTRRLHQEMLSMENDKNQSREQLNRQIQREKSKVENLKEELEVKQKELTNLEIALKQQTKSWEQFKLKSKQRQEEIKHRQEQLRAEAETIRQSYETQMEKLQNSYNEKTQMSSSVIYDLQSVVDQRTQQLQNIQTQLRQMKLKQSHLMTQVQEHKTKLTIQRKQYLQLINELKQQLRQKSLHIQELQYNVQFFQQLQQQYEQKYQEQELKIDEANGQLQILEQNNSELTEKLHLKTQQMHKLQYDTLNNKQLVIEIQQLKKAIAITQSEKTILEENLTALNQELTKLKKLHQQSITKLTQENQQLIIQLKITVDNLEKKQSQTEQILRAINEIKLAKNNIENQYCQLVESSEKEKKKTKQHLQALNNEVFMLRDALEDKQQLQNDLFKEIDTLRTQAKHSQAVHQASNLLKMDLQALQNDVQRLNKEKTMVKKQRQSMSEQLSESRMQLRFVKQENDSMKHYIEELEQNLEKLSEEKTALKNELHLYKQQAEFCKRESIQQLGIIDHLQRQLQSARYFCPQNRKQLKIVSQTIDPLTIVKRSSLSKGEKAYYIKEMIQQYGNEMKKNLENIGALSHEEINELIASELKELQLYVKKLQREYW